MMMDSEEEEEQTALVCDNGKQREQASFIRQGNANKLYNFDLNYGL